MSDRRYMGLHVPDEAVQRALDARVPGGATVRAFLHKNTCADVIRSALAVILPERRAASDPPHPGEIVYTIDGREAEFVAGASGAYVIRYTYGEDAYELGDPVMVREIYSAPPKERWEKEIEKLELRAAELRSTIHEYEGEIRLTKKKLEDVRAKCAALPALEYLFDVIEGRISHFVVLEPYSYVVRVASVEDATTPEKNDTEWLSQRAGFVQRKLLTLWGKAGNDLRWRLNHYRDGSGHEREVIPCLSYEDAKAAALGRLELYASKIRAEGLKPGHTYDDILKSYEALNAPPPSDIAEHSAAAKFAQLERIARERDAEAAKAKAALDEASKRRAPF